MIEAAENICLDYSFQKNYLNHYALKSHQKAVHAKETKLLDELIFPIKDFEDQGIKDTLTLKLLDRLPAILGKNKQITVGNACLTHDGAAFVTLSQRESPFEMIDYTEVAGDPKRCPELVVKATKAILERNELTMSCIDAVEWNEAFAVTDALFDYYFSGFRDIYNIFGGALAYGHPYGASGAINLLHLMQALKLKKGKLGVTAIAAAGGVAIAILVSYKGE